MLKTPIQALRKGRIEQAIIRRYLAILKEQTASSSEEVPDLVPFNA